MSIALTCTGCQYPFQVPAAAAGRRVACPKCQVPLRVPSGPPPAPVAGPPPPVPMVFVGSGPPPPAARDEPLRIVITDFDIRFLSIVGLMLKITLAAIPATIILAAIGAVCSMAFWVLIQSAIHR